MTIKSEINKIFRNYETNKKKLSVIHEKIVSDPISIVKENASSYDFKDSSKSTTRKVKRYQKMLIERRNLEKNIYLRDILMNQLNEKEKEIFKLKFEEKLEMEKIANRMYISASTLYRRQKKIYEKLSVYYYSFQELFKK